MHRYNIKNRYIKDHQKTINVLHIISDLTIGGAQNSLVRLLPYINQSEFSCMVACLRHSDTPLASKLRELEIPVFDIQMTSQYRLDGVWRLYKLLNHLHPTIIHCWMYHANILGRLVGYYTGIPIIITTRRNINIGGFLREFTNKITMDLSTKVVAVCELARQLEIINSNLEPDKVITIYNGIDFLHQNKLTIESRFHARSALDIPNEAFVVGYVGRLHPQKGLTYLIQAISLVAKKIPNLRLCLVGSGQSLREIEHTCFTHNLHNIILITGERQDIPEILPAFDLFVSSSLWEGQSNAILEAMATGIPVITTSVGGTPEIIKNYKNGILVPPRDFRNLSDAIMQLYQDTNLASSLAVSAREYIQKNHLITNIAQQYIDLYRELVLREESIL